MKFLVFSFMLSLVTAFGFCDDQTVDQEPTEVQKSLVETLKDVAASQDEKTAEPMKNILEASQGLFEDLSNSNEDSEAQN